MNNSYHIPSLPSSLLEKNVLSPEEEKYLIEDLNNTASRYPDDVAIIGLFEEQVEKTPWRVALVFENTEITYAQLNAISNRLAAWLRKHYNLKPGDLVGIKLARSEWMVIGILGVMKSGAAYVPIDPAYPAERIEYMIADSGCKVVIGEAEMEAFRNTNGLYDDGNCAVGLLPHNLAYCIYTSGSTGNPKGVLIEHRNLVNFITAQKKLFDITEDERILQLSSISFEASAEQIWLALLSGAALVVAGQQLLDDAKELERYISAQGITHIDGVASFLALLDIKDCGKLKRVMSGGETCTVALAEKWSAKCDFYNAYGPTETTALCIEFHVKPGVDYGGKIPIGRPLSNVQAYVMDAQQQLVPFGQPGELCIGGAGVARGYLNQPRLTAQRFVAHPFSQGERIYRTGDRARWLPDGNLEYLGRMDGQLKIRGFRIEPEEVEAALLRHPQVSAVVVIAGDAGGQEQELIAYTTGAATGEMLREHLSSLLPAYMVPAFFVHLHQMPLTTAGKLDKKALPALGNYGFSKETYIAAATETERRLVRIWSEILNTGEEKISTLANFASLGGHSLKAIRLLGPIHREFGVKLPLSQLSAGSTITEIAKKIGRLAAASHDSGNICFNISDSPQFTFYFPSIIGYPIGLDSLFTGMDGFNVYGFIYSNEEDFLQACVKTICRLATGASYISLMGYSAGGTIAFEAAREAAKLGLHIDLVFLIDCLYQEKGMIKISDQETGALIAKLRKTDKLSGSLSTADNYDEEVTYSFGRYMNNVFNSGCINARIINYVSVEGQNIIDHNKWAAATNAEYRVVEGVGGHESLFNPEFESVNKSRIHNLFQLEKGELNIGSEVRS